MTAPERDVYVMVGDGSYLMMNSETVTSIQENYRLIIVLFDNHDYKSTGSLSRSPGQDGFGTRYAYPRNGILPGDEVGSDVQVLPVDLAAQEQSAVSADAGQ
jgi:3D-(3,5/4)-trihydroxycyclohexane-1,2-dione acylhydrolase (decyclizing)